MTGSSRKRLELSRADVADIKLRYRTGEYANSIRQDYQHISRWQVYGIARGDYDDYLKESALSTKRITRLLAWPR